MFDSFDSEAKSIKKISDSLVNLPVNNSTLSDHLS